jgi:hypothetical protein
MGSVTTGVSERRRECRCSASQTRWNTQAVLRPGVPITVINISGRAALVESPMRLRPGALTEMQLAGAGSRTSVRGRLERCYVAAIEPLRYRGVLIFDEPLDLSEF